MAKHINYREVAATNPAVDTKKMEQLLVYRTLMEKAGLYEKPNYRLSPALGPTPNKPMRTHLFRKLGVRVF
jgi:hypothetical protein